MAVSKFTMISFQSNTQSMFSQRFAGPCVFKNILTCQTVKKWDDPDRNALKCALIHEHRKGKMNPFLLGLSDVTTTTRQNSSLKSFIICAGWALVAQNPSVPRSVHEKWRAMLAPPWQNNQNLLVVTLQDTTNTSLEITSTYLFHW